MAKKNIEQDFDPEIEEFDEEYDDDEETEGDGGRRWMIFAAIGVVVLCLGIAVVVWLARDTLLAPVAGLMATETSTATVTPVPTSTFTPMPSPTDTEMPTSTIAPSPTPLMLPPNEVMAIVDGSPVLDEQFNDNNRNWTSLGEGAEYTIQQGMMVFKSALPGQQAVVYCITDCGPYSDRYFAQTEIVDERGSDASHGLVFGIDPQRNVYYVFRVKPSTGQFGLFKRIGADLTPMIEWTQSPAVLPAPTPNTLGVRYLANKIDLYVNGTWVGEKQDKNNAYNSGRVGLYVEQDGARLLANQLKVYNLLDVTPEPPGTRPTVAIPPAGQPPAAQPTAGAPGLPANTPVPQPTAKFTLTPTVYGSCPNYIPAGKWALVITKVGPNNRSAQITINGTEYKITDLTTAFYLDQKVNYVVKIGNKTFEFYYDKCMIVYKKVQV